MPKIYIPLIVTMVALSMAAHADSHIKRFGAMDTNNDNIISKNESLAYHNMMFSKKDKNGDGKITQIEYDAYYDAKKGKQKKRYFWNKDKIQDSRKENADDTNH